MKRFFTLASTVLVLSALVSPALARSLETPAKAWFYDSSRTINPETGRPLTVKEKLSSARTKLFQISGKGSLDCGDANMAGMITFGLLSIYAVGICGDHVKEVQVHGVEFSPASDQVLILDLAATYSTNSIRKAYILDFPNNVAARAFKTDLESGKITAIALPNFDPNGNTPTASSRSLFAARN